MLSWALKTYPGPQLMADPSLGIPAVKVPSLLDREIVTTLQTLLRSKVAFHPRPSYTQAH